MEYTWLPTTDRDSVKEAIHKATNKRLRKPDEALNKQVVELINKGSSQIRGHVLVGLIIERIRETEETNGWKLFLMMHLLRKVMAECEKRIGDSTNELLQEFAMLITKPPSMNLNAAKAEEARMMARKLLQDHGKAGQAALEWAYGPGRLNKDGYMKFTYSSRGSGGNCR